MKPVADLGINLDDVIDGMALLVLVMSPDFDVLQANDRWTALLIQDQSEQQVYNFRRDLVPLEHQTYFDSVVTRLQQGERIADFVTPIQASSGLYLVVQGMLIPHMRDGELVHIVGIWQDVTALHAENEDLKTLFHISLDLMGIADYAGRFIQLNPAWEKTLGYDRDEMIGKAFLDFVHPDDVLMTEKEAERATRGYSNSGFTNRYRHKNGSYRWLTWTYQSYPERAYTYFVAKDVTQVKDADDRLKEATGQLQAILDNSGTVISMKDVRGYYILVNLEFALRFGKGSQDKTQFAGVTDYDLFPQAIADKLRNNDRQALDAGTAMQFEETLPGDDGLHTYLVTKFVLRDVSDEPYAICSISTDITYRKLTELQLRMRNQAIEFSPSAISIADATLTDMPLIYVNPAFERTTGYSPLDAIGRNCRFLQNDDREQPEVDEIRRAIEAEDSVTVVLRNYRRGGEMFYNELSLAPIHDTDGQLTHYVGISTDVTTRVEAEAKIQEQYEALRLANRDLAIARQEAEEAAAQIQKQNDALLRANRDLAIARKHAEDATRLKSQFLATMSHELRTPLNAIIGYTEIQLAGMTGVLNDEQSDFQQRVLANAEHLLALINDVLDIAKIEAGRMELVHKAFDLPRWVDDVVKQMRVLTTEKGLAFEVAVDDRMPRTILGDPARIRQVAINLLSNAIKFTDQGFVRLQIRKHGPDAWKLIVSDSGIGIPPHMQETIFEEFRQVDSSTLRKAGGTGLGLAIVRKFVLMMGGTIRLKSDLGQGSTFTVILPLEPQSTPSADLENGDENHD